MASERGRALYKNAAAIAYEEGRDAPSVSALGQMTEADLLVSLAERFGIPVVEHPVIARLLNQRELDEDIPPVLFEAVAAVLEHLEREGYVPAGAEGPRKLGKSEG